MATERRREPTDEEWLAAREIYEATGASLRDVQAETGIPRSTLQARAAVERWQKREAGAAPIGATPQERAAATAAGRAEAARKREALRLEMADRLLRETSQVLDRLNAPATYKEAKVVSDGAQQGAHVEVVEIETDTPAARDQQAIATAAAILIDKFQLLTGEATSRGETVERTREEREARIGQLRDELQQRREAKGA